jgi:hypothetical protein
MPLTAFIVVAQVLVAIGMPRSPEVQVLAPRGQVADGQTGTKSQNPRPARPVPCLERAKGLVPGTRDRMPGSMRRHPESRSPPELQAWRVAAKQGHQELVAPAPSRERCVTIAL